MRTLTYAAIVLAAAAGAAPAMAQSVQPVAPDAAIATQAQPPLYAPALTPVGGWAGIPGAADGMYNGYGQPNQLFGIPGGGQASASPHPAP